VRIARINIDNFRGIAKGELFFSDHTALVGDNNAGKSTVLEAIDLVLGPERLSRQSIIDEHDFHVGRYIDSEGNPVEIKVEVVVVDLIEEQIRYFKDHLEWWNEPAKKLLDGPPPEGATGRHRSAGSFSSSAGRVYGSLRQGRRRLLGNDVFFITC
jgi:putative ATP-dependent endonuclease of the OLD family